MLSGHADGSVDPRWDHIPSRHDRIRTVALVSAIALVLLFSSLLPFAGLSGGSSPKNQDDSKTPTSSNAASHSWSSSHGHNWDWSKIADKDGFVNVIITYNENQPSTEKTTSIQSEKHGPTSDILEKFKGGERERFVHVSYGFSAHVSIELLNDLLVLNDSSISVYPDLPVHATVNWDILDIGADQIWARDDPIGRPATGTGIVVAVIDTGVDYLHPDLGGGFGSGYKVIGGYDFYNRDSDPMDDNGHGTHVAGTIAANGDIVGVAPDASILAYKVLGSDGTGMMSDVIAGIDRAIDPNSDGDTSDHADVISMSLGGPGGTDDPVCEAVRDAVAAGVVVVVAAGNEGPSMGTVASPGISPEAITVGAVDASGALARFSSRGTSPDLSIKPEISAPGVNVTSTVPYSNAPLSSPTGHMTLSGTSMATPHVSGAAALLLQLHPTWTPQQVKSALITGANLLGESLWSAGAGELWLPKSADTVLFADPALISYGLAGDVAKGIGVVNADSPMSLSLKSSDWMALSADGTAVTRQWTNTSSVSPTSLSLGSGGTGTASVTVPVPSGTAPEGYYDGEVRLTGALADLRVPVGFAVLSRVNVHVLDPSGREVLDPYGGVWIYNVPDGDIAIGIRGSVEKPAPPASFLMPSGEYSIHSIGHQLLYDYSSPYVLSGALTLNRLQTADVYLNMSSARQLTLDLMTADGHPIYVKDYRVYIRHEGVNNISFHIVGSDYSIKGSEIFTLPTSKVIYVSDTDATVGISIAGFSYSRNMWDFMSRNWQHWYEYVSGTSNEFYIEASTDLQYFLAWEFDGVGASTPSDLTLVPGQYSVYDTKYDIPGSLVDIWGDWGNHRSAGGDASFYVRRDTDTSLNSFFSGMTRRTYVQGVFSELYYPGSLFSGFLEREYYTPDYSHVFHADTASAIYLPDRTYLTPLGANNVEDRLGAGPFYPSIWTENTADSLVLFQPTLRDQSGAKVGGMSMPSMRLERNGQLVGIYQLSEFLARPDAERMVSLPGVGSYSAQITYAPSPQVCDDVSIELGFSSPASDSNPPRITGLTMPQRFVPGSSVGLSISAVDDASPVSLQAWWRAGSAFDWTTLSVNQVSGSEFTSSIQTSSSDSQIDLKIRATDSSGNFIEYIASNAAKEQLPVLFELSAQTTDIGYRNGDVTVLLTGHLTDISGNPLHASAGVPLELMVGDRKVGMVLDEYVEQGSHVHDGNIRFEWHLNPILLFNGPNEDLQVNVSFDLGTYEPVSRSFVLHSIEFVNKLPIITLDSPTNGSLIPAGERINLTITDDGTFTAETSLDGGSFSQLGAPYDLNTSQWSEGNHSLEVIVTDDQLAVVSSSYRFEIDATIPTVSILSPLPLSMVPVGWTLVAEVADSHLAQVTYTLDGGSPQSMTAPYTIDMTSWPVGNHTVVIQAVDLVGHSASNFTIFEIRAGNLVINLLSPQDGAIVHSGVPISFSVLTVGTYTSRWFEQGVWHSLGSSTTIPTDGWIDGAHDLVINSTDQLGGWDELSMSLTIDDTPPLIQLQSPLNGSFVDTLDRIQIHVADDNFNSTVWTLWGQTRTSTSVDVSVSLTNRPGDGHFALNVVATDKAGNEAKDLFMFAMDSSPPLLSIIGLVSGGAVLPSQAASVNASDVFLAGVSLSLDSGVPTYLMSPYQFNCSSMSLGWHALQFVASDYSGKSSMLNLSIYVDDVAPIVIQGFPTKVVANSTALLEANITDDFAVARAELHYQLKDGTFMSVLMQANGSSYSATLPGGSLWDGMLVFVRAYDTVGHVSESEHVVLHVTADTDGGSVTPPSDDHPGGGAIRFDSFQGALAVISLAVISGSVILCVLLFARRSRRREETSTSKPSYRIDKQERPKMEPEIPAEREPLPSAIRSAPIIIKETPETESRPVSRVAAPSVTTAAAPAIEAKRVTLLDAIPEVTLKSPSIEATEVDDGIDYGDLIEKELIIPGLKDTVFAKELQDEYSEIDKQFDEIEKLFSKSPKKSVE